MTKYVNDTKAFKALREQVRFDFFLTVQDLKTAIDKIEEEIIEEIVNERP